VTGSSPTGTVHVSDNNGNLDGGTGNFKLNSFGYFEDQAIQLATGSHTIQANYLGDNSFSASGPTSGMITVTKASTTAAVTPSVTSVAANTAFSLSVLVDTLTSSNPPVGSSGVAPTGTVVFAVTTTSAVFKPGRRDWPEPNRFLIGEVCTALGFLFALLFATTRRRGAVLLGMAVVIVLAVGISCGSSGSNPANITTTLTPVNLTATTDVNGFAAATATLSNVKLMTTGTITATYSGDGNYNTTTSPSVTVTVH
jgi:hypothetical protein